MKTEKLVVEYVRIASIKAAPYNPPNRMELKRTNTLIKSMATFGMRHPLDIDKKKNLIDGHRRLFAAQQLGLKTVPVLFQPNSVTNAILYRELNGEVKPHNGPERLRVWLKEPTAVKPYFARKAERYEKWFGRDLLEFIAKSNCSIDIIDWGRKIWEHKHITCTIRQFVEWTIKHRAGYFIRVFPHMKMTYAELNKIIANDEDFPR